MFSAVIDSIRDLRNRKIADPSFRRWAVRFPLTRAIARRQAKSLFDLTAGFVYSQVLGACVEVDLFEVLASGPQDVAEIAEQIGLPREGTERLLKAAAALDLVESRGTDRFSLGRLGAALVGNRGVTAMIRHHAILYGDLREPLALLAGRAGTQLQRYWVYSEGTRREPADPERHADYSKLMSASQSFVTAEILDAHSLSRHRRMLDVGGGDGTFLIAAGEAGPHLELELFDLPPVAEVARARIIEAGLSGRARAYGGSFLVDPLPEGADLITLNRVLHDHDDPSALAILSAIRRSIAPHGTLLIAEPMAGTPGAEASGDAYFGFYLLAMGQGRPRTMAEMKRLLAAAGFGRATEVATNTPLIARIVTASP